MIRVLLFILLFFSENCFAKEIDKIKFHLPETEAEKELDYILTAQYFKDIGDKKPSKSYDDFEESLKALHTNEFMIAFYKLKERDSKKKCEYDIECFPHDGLYLYCGFSSFILLKYLYYSEQNELNTFIYIIFDDKDTEYKELRQWERDYIVNIIKKQKGYYSKYIMKKEDGKWKIDGICCNDNYTKNCPYQSPK